MIPPVVTFVSHSQKAVIVLHSYSHCSQSKTHYLDGQGSISLQEFVMWAQSDREICQD